MARGKMTQGEKDFNKAKNTLMGNLESFKWKTLDDDGRTKIQSVLDIANNGIGPVMEGNLVMDLSKLGPQKMKQVQAFLAGKATFVKKK